MLALKTQLDNTKKGQSPLNLTDIAKSALHLYRTIYDNESVIEFHEKLLLPLLIEANESFRRSRNSILEDDDEHRFRHAVADIVSSVHVEVFFNSNNKQDIAEKCLVQALDLAHGDSADIAEPLSLFLFVIVRSVPIPSMILRLFKQITEILPKLFESCERLIRSWDQAAPSRYQPAATGLKPGNESFMVLKNFTNMFQHLHHQTQDVLRSSMGRAVYSSQPDESTRQLLKQAVDMFQNVQMNFLGTLIPITVTPATVDATTVFHLSQFKLTCTLLAFRQYFLDSNQRRIMSDKDIKDRMQMIVTSYINILSVNAAFPHLATIRREVMTYCQYILPPPRSLGRPSDRADSIALVAMRKSLGTLKLEGVVGDMSVLLNEVHGVTTLTNFETLIVKLVLGPLQPDDPEWQETTRSLVDLWLGRRVHEIGLAPTSIIQSAQRFRDVVERIAKDFNSTVITAGAAPNHQNATDRRKAISARASFVRSVGRAYLAIAEQFMSTLLVPPATLYAKDAKEAQEGFSCVSAVQDKVSRIFTDRHIFSRHHTTSPYSQTKPDDDEEVKALKTLTGLFNCGRGYDRFKPEHASSQLAPTAIATLVYWVMDVVYYTVYSLAEYMVVCSKFERGDEDSAVARAAKEIIEAGLVMNFNGGKISENLDGKLAAYQTVSTYANTMSHLWTILQPEIDETMDRALALLLDIASTPMLIDQPRGTALTRFQRFDPPRRIIQFLSLLNPDMLHAKLSRAMPHIIEVIEGVAPEYSQSFILYQTPVAAFINWVIDGWAEAGHIVFDAVHSLALELDSGVDVSLNKVRAVLTVATLFIDTLFRDHDPDGGLEISIAVTASRLSEFVWDVAVIVGAIPDPKRAVILLSRVIKLARDNSTRQLESSATMITAVSRALPLLFTHLAPLLDAHRDNLNLALMVLDILAAPPVHPTAMLEYLDLIVPRMVQLATVGTAADIATVASQLNSVIRLTSEDACLAKLGPHVEDLVQALTQVLKTKSPKPFAQQTLTSSSTDRSPGAQVDILDGNVVRDTLFVLGNLGSKAKASFLAPLAPSATNPKPPMPFEITINVLAVVLREQRPDATHALTLDIAPLMENLWRDMEAGETDLTSEDSQKTALSSVRLVFAAVAGIPSSDMQIRGERYTLPDFNPSTAAFRGVIGRTVGEMNEAAVKMITTAFRILFELPEAVSGPTLSEIESYLTAVMAQPGAFDSICTEEVCHVAPLCSVRALLELVTDPLLPTIPEPNATGRTAVSRAVAALKAVFEGLNSDPEEQGRVGQLMVDRLSDAMATPSYAVHDRCRDLMTHLLAKDTCLVYAGRTADTALKALAHSANAHCDALIHKPLADIGRLARGITGVRRADTQADGTDIVRTILDLVFTSRHHQAATLFAELLDEAPNGPSDSTVATIIGHVETRLTGDSPEGSIAVPMTNDSVLPVCFGLAAIINVLGKYGKLKLSDLRSSVRRIGTFATSLARMVANADHRAVIARPRTMSLPVTAEGTTADSNALCSMCRFILSVIIHLPDHPDLIDNIFLMFQALLGAALKTELKFGDVVIERLPEALQALQAMDLQQLTGIIAEELKPETLSSAVSIDIPVTNRPLQRPQTQQMSSAIDPCRAHIPILRLIRTVKTLAAVGMNLAVPLDFAGLIQRELEKLGHEEYHHPLLSVLYKPSTDAAIDGNAYRFIQEHISGLIELGLVVSAATEPTAVDSAGQTPKDVYKSILTLARTIGFNLQRQTCMKPPAIPRHNITAPVLIPAENVRRDTYDTPRTDPSLAPFTAALGRAAGFNPTALFVALCRYESNNSNAVKGSRSVMQETCALGDEQRSIVDKASDRRAKEEALVRWTQARTAIRVWGQIVFDIMHSPDGETVIQAITDEDVRGLYLYFRAEERDTYFQVFVSILARVTAAVPTKLITSPFIVRLVDDFRKHLSMTSNLHNTPRAIQHGQWVFDSRSRPLALAVLRGFTILACDGTLLELDAKHAAEPPIEGVMTAKELRAIFCKTLPFALSYCIHEAFIVRDVVADLCRNAPTAELVAIQHVMAGELNALHTFCPVQAKDGARQSPSPFSPVTPSVLRHVMQPITAEILNRARHTNDYEAIMPALKTVILLCGITNPPRPQVGVELLNDPAAPEGLRQEQLALLIIIVQNIGMHLPDAFTEEQRRTLIAMLTTPGVIGGPVMSANIDHMTYLLEAQLLCHPRAHDFIRGIIPDTDYGKVIKELLDNVFKNRTLEKTAGPVLESAASILISTMTRYDELRMHVGQRLHHAMSFQPNSNLWMNNHIPLIFALQLMRKHAYELYKLVDTLDPVIFFTIGRVNSPEILMPLVEIVDTRLTWHVRGNGNDSDRSDRDSNQDIISRFSFVLSRVCCMFVMYGARLQSPQYYQSLVPLQTRSVAVLRRAAEVWPEARVQIPFLRDVFLKYVTDKEEDTIKAFIMPDQREKQLGHSEPESFARLLPMVEMLQVCLHNTDAVSAFFSVPSPQEMAHQEIQAFMNDFGKRIDQFVEIFMPAFNAADKMDTGMFNPAMKVVKDKGLRLPRFVRWTDMAPVYCTLTELVIRLLKNKPHRTENSDPLLELFVTKTIDTCKCFLSDFRTKMAKAQSIWVKHQAVQKRWRESSPADRHMSVQFQGVVGCQLHIKMLLAIGRHDTRILNQSVDVVLLLLQQLCTTDFNAIAVETLYQARSGGSSTPSLKDCHDMYSELATETDILIALCIDYLTLHIAHQFRCALEVKVRGFKGVVRSTLGNRDSGLFNQERQSMMMLVKHGKDISSRYVKLFNQVIENTKVLFRQDSSYILSRPRHALRACMRFAAVGFGVIPDPELISPDNYDMRSSHPFQEAFNTAPSEMFRCYFDSLSSLDTQPLVYNRLSIASAAPFEEISSGIFNFLTHIAYAIKIPPVVRTVGIADPPFRRTAFLVIQTTTFPNYDHSAATRVLAVSGDCYLDGEGARSVINDALFYYDEYCNDLNTRHTDSGRKRNTRKKRKADAGDSQAVVTVEVDMTPPANPHQALCRLIANRFQAILGSLNWTLVYESHFLSHVARMFLMSLEVSEVTTSVWPRTVFQLNIDDVVDTIERLLRISPLNGREVFIQLFVNMYDHVLKDLPSARNELIRIIYGHLYQDTPNPSGPMAAAYFVHGMGYKDILVACLDRVTLPITSADPLVYEALVTRRSLHRMAALPIVERALTDGHPQSLAVRRVLRDCAFYHMGDDDNAFGTFATTLPTETAPNSTKEYLGALGEISKGEVAAEIYNATVAGSENMLGFMQLVDMRTTLLRDPPTLRVAGPLRTAMIAGLLGHWNIAQPLLLDVSKQLSTKREDGTRVATIADPATELYIHRMATATCRELHQWDVIDDVASAQFEKHHTIDKSSKSNEARNELIKLYPQIQLVGFISPELIVESFIKRQALVGDLTAIRNQRAVFTMCEQCYDSASDTTFSSAPLSMLLWTSLAYILDYTMETEYRGNTERFISMLFTRCLDMLTQTAHTHGVQSVVLRIAQMVSELSLITSCARKHEDTQFYKHTSGASHLSQIMPLLTQRMPAKWEGISAFSDAVTFRTLVLLFIYKLFNNELLPDRPPQQQQRRPPFMTNITAIRSTLFRRMRMAGLAMAAMNATTIRSDQEQSTTLELNFFVLRERILSAMTASSTWFSFDCAIHGLGDMKTWSREVIAKNPTTGLIKSETVRLRVMASLKAGMRSGHAVDLLNVATSISPDNYLAWGDLSRELANLAAQQSTAEQAFSFAITANSAALRALTAINTPTKVQTLLLPMLVHLADPNLPAAVREAMAEQLIAMLPSLSSSLAIHLTPQLIGILRITELQAVRRAVAGLLCISSLIRREEVLYQCRALAVETSDAVDGVMIQTFVNQAIKSWWGTEKFVWGVLSDKSPHKFTAPADTACFVISFIFATKPALAIAANSVAAGLAKLRDVVSPFDWLTWAITQMIAKPGTHADKAILETVVELIKDAQAKGEIPQKDAAKWAALFDPRSPPSRQSLQQCLKSISTLPRRAQRLPSVLLNIRPNTVAAPVIRPRQPHQSSHDVLYVLRGTVERLMKEVPYVDTPPVMFNLESPTFTVSDVCGLPAAQLSLRTAPVLADDTISTQAGRAHLMTLAVLLTPPAGLAALLPSSIAQSSCPADPLEPMPGVIRSLVAAGATNAGLFDHVIAAPNLIKRGFTSGYHMPCQISSTAACIAYVSGPTVSMHELAAVHSPGRQQAYRMPTHVPSLPSDAPKHEDGALAAHLARSVDPGVAWTARTAIAHAVAANLTLSHIYGVMAKTGDSPDTTVDVSRGLAHSIGGVFSPAASHRALRLLLGPVLPHGTVAALIRSISEAILRPKYRVAELMALNRMLWCGDTRQSAQIFANSALTEARALFPDLTAKDLSCECFDFVDQLVEDALDLKLGQV
ncbi:HEAT repeat [Carpediemonas membranifera]|uniref:HEAT repeat n=1 Tax=Carpediemonas membranifera TaxID=201153 RepID=A0A8J6BWQ0_9EUKA|nr:HEAT repeat [Carpediemonas membranifera]|eukprot:KAG9392661.1 HEAT repeat [Carpediemonas membranifera]